MKGTKYIFGLGLLALALFTACGNILDSPPATNSSGNDGLVRIYLGAQTTGARTVQPGQAALAGYRLTFVGNSETPHDPVDITGADHADVYLTDGTWTITAKAYKLSGTIGEESDKIAEGSIAVTLSGGAVEGAVSPIILRSTAVGNGTLHYRITLPTGVTGALKLWDINDTAVSGFGDNGVFTFAASFTGDYPLAAGRYIAEASLTNHEGGGVGFRREVVEIWADTTSDFVFAPGEFLDPNVVRMEEGIYISILGFDQAVHEIAAPTLLNSTSRDALKDKMDTLYTKSTNNGTLLYYSVHKALNAIVDMDLRLPDNTQSINIITFTDGVDVGSISPILWGNSPLAGFDFYDDVTGDEYLTWIHEQLAHTEVKNNFITASAYGVAGDDINASDMAIFENNMASLATQSGEHSTSIQFNELSAKFGEIATGLNVMNTNTSFNLLLTPPSGGNGTIFKMTFDNIQDADSSTEWFTGEYRYSGGTYTLSNLQYAGIASGEGYSPLPSSLTGTVVGSEIQYYFDSLNLSGIPLTERTNVQQWFKNPGASDWQHLVEYDKGDAASSTTEQKTAVIYLILDSSKSLSESNAAEIRQAAKDFIDAVYQRYEENITYTVRVANAITGGTVSATPTGGLKGTTVYLSNTPENGYPFEGYTVNGTPISGNSFTLNGNAVVSAVFTSYTVTVANGISHGSISASPISGPPGTTVSLSNTPESGYSFGGYTVNGTAITGNSFTLNGNAVVSAVFASTVTVATGITGGSISASPTSGTSGTTVTLSNTPSSGYALSYYTVNGTQISGNSFTLNGNVTVSAVFILSRISSISYSGSWTLESDGRYRSPAIGHSQTTKCRVNFTSTGSNNQLVIALTVSSESNYDFAFVGALDSTASYSSYFDRISGTLTKTITISVPNPGSHFVEIGYGKDGSQYSGSDCAWFRIVN
ncbi:MAG: hypothetical protein LBJ41_03245 [Treponema sp.]|jgi:hypothetical protein|nr:hypothetical protein [Treponema sp.]